MKEARKSCACCAFMRRSGRDVAALLPRKAPVSRHFFNILLHADEHAVRHGSWLTERSACAGFVVAIAVRPHHCLVGRKARSADCMPGAPA